MSGLRSRFSGDHPRHCESAAQVQAAGGSPAGGHPAGLVSALTNGVLSSSSSQDLWARAARQWQMGDWQSLAALDCTALAGHPERARLAILAAAGCFQNGATTQARTCIRLAREWGASQNELAQILIASAHDSLARAASLAGRHDRALAHSNVALALSVAADPKASSRVSGSAGQVVALPQIHANPSPDPEASSHPFPIDALYARLAGLVQRLRCDGTAMRMDGDRVFDGRDPFLPGKTALGLAYHATEPGLAPEETASRARLLALIAGQMLDHPLESWGIWFYLEALRVLREGGLLEACIAPGQLALLRARLHWRGFVDETEYRLIAKPTNYYGLAYGIAALRLQLGWDDELPCQRLLERIVEHYHKHSGRFGFADDTDGHGRFDRYSFLLIAELASHMRKAGQPLSAEMLEWLRRSVDFVLANLNTRGDGFAYGRSIGAYGDTAFMEILAASAAVQLLSAPERTAAHAFCHKATDKFLAYWWDEAHGRVDLWDGDRRTDAYRGKSRMLGETFSLLHQHLYVHQLWNSLRLSDPLEDVAFQSWLDQRPRHLVTQFSEREYSRAVVTVRDGQRILNLPLVNGHEFHARSAYSPVPKSPDLFPDSGDELFPPLVPRLTLTDHTVLAPLVWFQNLAFKENDEVLTVAWDMNALNDLSGSTPQADQRVSCRCSYRFEPGLILRHDFLVPSLSLELQSLDMFLVVACSDYEQVPGRALFTNGPLRTIEAHGFDQINLTPILREGLPRNPGLALIMVHLHTESFVLTSPRELSVAIQYETSGSLLSF